MFGIRVLCRRSETSPFDASHLTELAARIGLKRAWELRVSCDATPPVAMTWGAVRPIILLPRDAGRWPKERLEAVLLHELAHIQRYDSTTQLLTFALCALYWFHPAVWLAARALRAEAEAAADDAVLLSGVKPSAYAAQLLYFAAHLGQKRQPFAVMGASLMKQSKIETRILSLLDSSRRRRPLTPFEVLRGVGIGLITVLILASVHPAFSSARAQQESLASLKPTPLLSSLRQTMKPLSPLTKAAAPPQSPKNNRSQKRSSRSRSVRRSPDVLINSRPTPHPAPPASPDIRVGPKANPQPIPHAPSADVLRVGRVSPNTARTIPTRSADAVSVPPQASSNKRTAVSSDVVALRQRIAAEADMRRGEGNAHGKGEVAEAMAKQREADIRKAIPDAGDADRFLSEADRISALRRRKQR